MKNAFNEAQPASLREKLDFVRRTPTIFTSWLLFAIAVALIGWGVVFANTNAAHKVAQDHAVLEAAALARTHADRLLRSINAIDQITHHIRVE
jgi:type VI protein secretion system component VasK